MDDFSFEAYCTERLGACSVEVLVWLVCESYVGMVVTSRGRKSLPSKRGWGVSSLTTAGAADEARGLKWEAIVLCWLSLRQIGSRMKVERAVRREALKALVCKW